MATHWSSGGLAAGRCGESHVVRGRIPGCPSLHLLRLHLSFAVVSVPRTATENSQPPQYPVQPDRRWSSSGPDVDGHRLVGVIDTVAVLLRDARNQARAAAQADCRAGLSALFTIGDAALRAALTAALAGSRHSRAGGPRPGA